MLGVRNGCFSQLDQGLGEADFLDEEVPVREVKNLRQVAVLRECRVNLVEEFQEAVTGSECRCPAQPGARSGLESIATAIVGLREIQCARR